ncbi:MAG: helix-turn-helix transcriptional regulator [Pseudomonadota bacterium]
MSKIVRFDSISDIHRALGLGAPAHPLVSVLSIDQRIKEYQYGDDKFVFGFYQVAFKSGISGSIAYGRSQYDFNEGSMVFSKPGQALQFLVNEDGEDDSGWVLLFHPDLIRQSSLGQTMDQYSFFGYDVNEALNLSEEERGSIEDLIDKIRSEYMSKIDQHSQKLIIANIELLLDYCLRYYDRQFYVRTNLNQDTLARFERVLSEYFQTLLTLDEGLPTVKYCASQLSISPAYLSDLLKKETGQNAQQHIQMQLMERAKTMLLSSDDQISQIAYSLGFEYPQHFSKLFKAKVGMSPAEYRKLQ